MPGLTFSVESAEAIPFAAAPTIAFRLRVVNPNASQVIQSVALRCQILIEASRRHYNAGERQGLRDLFGEPERWSQNAQLLEAGPLGEKEFQAIRDRWEECAPRTWIGQI